MDSFTEKSQKLPGGWELQPQTPMGLAVAWRGICNGGGCFGGENQIKRSSPSSSKSLLGVRRKKGRVSFKKKRSASQTGSILVWIIIILPPNSGEDLKKQKRSSPQTGYVLVRISRILPPNFGEHQKKNI